MFNDVEWLVIYGYWLYSLENQQVAIENGDLQVIYTCKMAIFHSYVDLPEGNGLLLALPHIGMDFVNLI